MTAQPSVPRSAAIAMSVAAGLAIGILTSIGQGKLSETLDPFVNSASAWLVMPFLLGLAAGGLPEAAAAGLVCCLLQLVGYDIASEIRGFGVGGSINLFWGVCAVVGGPIFGAAGRLLRDGSEGVRGLGAATLAAAFIAEGAWNYLHELHRTASGLLWLAIGVVIAVIALRGPRGYRWLALTIPLGLLAELALTRIIA